MAVGWEETGDGHCDAAADWRAGGPFHQFIMFERSNYGNMTALYPCPLPVWWRTSPVWMYLTKSTGDDERVRNATTQDELFAWFSSRKVAELHLDVGGFLSSSADRALLTDGLRQACALGVHHGHSVPSM